MGYLKQKRGRDFDKAYIDLMVDDHKEDIDLFQKEADKGNDMDVKNWASGKVPILQHHLQMAQDIQSQLKKIANSMLASGSPIRSGRPAAYKAPATRLFGRLAAGSG